MAGVKRWSVTYTKHIKQKRKVYQDGYLDLKTSINKMLLYDDCEKLLEVKMLKKDEQVSCGETLTFNSFLVDVNDAVSADGGDNRKPLVNLNEKRAKPFVNTTRIKVVPNLSPSQKFIREFKSKELHKYGAGLSSPETTKTSKTEWQILYTTQLTQKAKKYHDGFLQLAICGSYGNQIILFDASRNQLDSRFLKKDEVIASGESIAFDAHLVEIGEREGDHKPLTNLHFKENKRNVVRVAGIKQEKNDDVMTDKAAETEWKVLYTTQVTQKAKKYHDGYLQLTMCGSQRRQAKLFDETRKLIDSKFLKKDDVISSGESFSFDAHLVDIGEPEGNHEPSIDLSFQGNNGYVQKNGNLGGRDDCVIVDNLEVKGNNGYIQKTGKSDGGGDCVIVDNLEVKEWNALHTTQNTQKAKKYHAGILRIAFSSSYHKKVSLLSEDKTMLSSKIISLSEDIRAGSMFELPKYLVEVGTPYVTSGDEEKSQNKDCLKKASNSNLSISSVNEPKPSRGAPKNKLLRDANQILSILQKPMAQESKVSGHADNSTTRSVASSKVSHVSDSIIGDSFEDGRPSEAHRSVEDTEPSEKISTRDLPDLMSFKAISSGSGGQVADGIDIRNSDQLYSSCVEADTKQNDRACTSKLSLNSCASHHAADEKKSISNEPSCATQIEECPSFDLGF